MLFRVGQQIVPIPILPDSGDGGTALFWKVSCYLPVYTA